MILRRHYCNQTKWVKTENFNAAGYAENTQPKSPTPESHIAFSFDIMGLEIILVEVNMTTTPFTCFEVCEGSQQIHACQNMPTE